jgi:hypothetical protein
VVETSAEVNGVAHGLPGRPLVRDAGTKTIMAPISFTISLDADPQWDAFVIANVDPHFEQLSAWGDAQRLRGWNPMRLLAYRGHSLIGGAQILEKRFGRLGRLAYLHRGPLFAGDDSEGKEAFVRELVRLCSSRRYLYVAVVLPYHGGDVSAMLARRGFVVLPAGLPPSASMKSTCILDLRAPEESLLAGMHRSTRQNVRKGMRKGVTIRPGTELDVPVFGELLNALCVRRGVPPNIPTGDFLLNVWRAFASSAQGMIFVATLGDVPVAARFVFSIGNWVRDWRHGWSGEHADLFPNEALDWHVIRWAKANGFAFYDFCGIDTRMARKMVSGEEMLPGESCRMSTYKLGFGGQILPLHDDYCWSMSRLARFGIRRGGSRLFQSHPFRRFLGNTAAE